MSTPAGSAERSHVPPRSGLSTWALHEVGAGILREVAAVCRGASIAFIPVKGIVTARLWYRDVAERPIGDVDVRIRRADLRVLQRAGKAAGWRCVRVLHSYGNLIYDFGSLSLDVEVTVGPPGLCGLDVATMIDRAEVREVVPGCRVAAPEIHDHAVLLTVNAFKDKIATAQPWAIADLERVVTQPDFRPERFVERVCEASVATMTWIVAEWMESMRDNVAWGAIRAALESRAPVRHAYARWVRRLMERADRAPMSLRVLARVAADSQRMRAEALAWAGACAVELALGKLTARS